MSKPEVRFRRQQWLVERKTPTRRRRRKKRRKMKCALRTDRLCTNATETKRDSERKKRKESENKAGYMAALVACGWAGIAMEKVTGAFGQEQ